MDSRFCLCLCTGLKRPEIKQSYTLVGSVCAHGEVQPFHQVNMPDAMSFGPSCGGKLVTQPSKIRGNETLEIHRVESSGFSFQGLGFGASSLGLISSSLRSKVEAQGFVIKS